MPDGTIECRGKRLRLPLCIDQSAKPGKAAVFGWDEETKKPVSVMMVFMLFFSEFSLNLSKNSGFFMISCNVPGRQEERYICLLYLNNVPPQEKLWKNIFPRWEENFYRSLKLFRQRKV